MVAKKRGGYKIAADDVVVEVALLCLKENGIVRSQSKLRELVNKRLRRRTSDYSVSSVRMRKLLLGTGKVSIGISTKEVNDRRRALSKCPVCGQKLKLQKNQTVFGGVVNTGYTCNNCGYHTGIKRSIPTRYSFSLKG